MAEKEKPNFIGLGRCPVRPCTSSKARYSLTKSGLTCVTCDRCNFQGFSRSGVSDENLRAHINPGQAEPVRAEPPSTTVKTGEQVLPPPAPDPVRTEIEPPPPEKPARRSLMSWSAS